MECEELIAVARNALGGLERIRGVRTYHAVARRVYDDGVTEEVRVWRAAGGRIRIERSGKRSSRIWIANGSRGTLDDDERADLVRDARVAPRNLLAHADEYRLALRSRPAPDGGRIVSFAGELVLYVFHSELHLCTRLIDLPRRRRIDFEDYRPVAGIPTAYVERHVVSGETGFRDTYEYVAYNLPLRDELFDVDVERGSAH